MIVLKLGGAALKSTLGDPNLFATLAKHPEPLVIVHGGGPEINALALRLGIETAFVDGQRVTTPPHMEIVEMVLSGKMNPALVRGLVLAGRKAVGVSGSDAGLFECVVEDPRLGLVGRVEKVRTSLLEDLLARGYWPVISPVGVFKDGRVCNVNADLATAAVAIALKADRLLFLTDRDGILDAGNEVVRELSPTTLQGMCDSVAVSGGMKVKARAILEVLGASVGCRVEVMNGLDPESLLGALKGTATGTLIKN